MQVFEKLFTAKEIEFFHLLKSVIAARENLKTSKKVTFTVKKSDLLESICQKINNFLPGTFNDTDEIPFRWIQGDTEPHVDREWNGKKFENTHIVYLSNSQGNLIVDENEYPIQEGNGYIFQEGLKHETRNTGFEPRLLLGPMSEQVKPVGASTVIQANGETETVYIRYDSGSGVTYKINNGPYSGISLPLYIQNTNTAFRLKVLFETDLVLQSSIWYIICFSDNIQFGSTSLKGDGTRPIITIDTVTNYPGFIQNGVIGGPGYNNIYVFNLDVRAINSSILNSNGGWIGQSYFGNQAQNNYIINCSSGGPIIDGGGGILGAYAGIGNSASQNSSSLYIIGCSSSGDISLNSGGIVGSNAGSSGGFVECKNCWSTGLIQGADSGGIFGLEAANDGGGGSVGGFARAIQCYSTGNLIGDESGGIFGSFAATNSTTVAEKCYSRGTFVDLNAGGIYGDSAASSSGTASAINCYSSEDFTSNNGIFSGGGSVVGRIQTNCFAADGNWADSSANAVLTGTPVSPSRVGDAWVSTVTNSPYELNSVGYTPYSLEIITFSGQVPSLVLSIAQTIKAGSSTIGAIRPGYSYDIYNITPTTGATTITMNDNTGVISTTSATTPGTYVITLRNTGSYNFTTFTLTVQESEPEPEPKRKKNLFLFNLLFGRRKIRLFDIAIIDVLGTVAIAYAISKRFCIPIQTSLLLVFTAGFTAHEIFSVNSQLNNLIKSRFQ